jgi:thiamine kinase-like enzyme
MEIIKSEQEITPAWIAEILGIESSLINSINVKYLGDMPISKAFIIQINYNKELNGPPKSLFVKITKEGISDKLKDFGKHEVAFYNKIAGKIGQDFISHCYYAVYNEELNIYNIVLEDLSETHFQTEYPISPAIEYCKQAIECLAKVHSAWWDNPELEAITTKFATGEQILQTNKYLQELCEKFFAALGDRFSKQRREILYKVLENVEKKPPTKYRNLTLVHGDAHYWNFLFPKKTEGKIKLIDWQLYRNGVGANDIAYIFALHWFPDRRKEYEMDLLRLYHEKLLDYGVGHYDFDDLLYDYKCSILYCLFVPIILWDGKIPALIWFNHIERIFAAYEDLKCEDILNN